MDEGVITEVKGWKANKKLERSVQMRLLGSHTEQRRWRDRAKKPMPSACVRHERIELRIRDLEFA
jgi:hypothetical protein